MKKNIIPWAKPDFYGYEEKFVKQALKSTWISDGVFVKKFEEQVSKYVGSKFGISVSNGTAAIHLVYLSLGLKKGDEVIIPGFGYLAAANIALLMGIKPVFADVDPVTFCVTSKSIEKQITSKTKLIVVIHTYGNVCDLDPIIKKAKQNKIPILEDTAESFGSTYKGKQSGSQAEISTFSFQATKTITTGEGGMVLTKLKKKFIENLKAYRNHGVKITRYFHHLPGHNFRLTNIQAAIGCAQLKKFSIIKKERKRIYDYYKKLFRNVDGVYLQKFNKNVRPVVWTFALLIDEKKFNNRDKLIKLLKNKGIECRNGFYSPCRLPLFKSYRTAHLKNANNLSKNIICLPFFCGLKNKQIDYIYNQFVKLKKIK